MVCTSSHLSHGAAKPIIDEIDRMLAQHYGFTDEELDFIINYDIKYRMGAESGEAAATMPTATARSRREGYGRVGVRAVA